MADDRSFRGLPRQDHPITVEQLAKIKDAAYAILGGYRQVIERHPEVFDQTVVDAFLEIDGKGVRKLRMLGLLTPAIVGAEEKAWLQSFSPFGRKMIEAIRNSNKRDEDLIDSAKQISGGCTWIEQLLPNISSPASGAAATR